MTTATAFELPRATPGCGQSTYTPLCDCAAGARALASGQSMCKCVVAVGRRLNLTEQHHTHAAERAGVPESVRRCEQRRGRERRHGQYVYDWTERESAAVGCKQCKLYTAVTPQSGGIVS